MKELNKKSNEDLAKLLNEKKESIRVSRFDIAGSSKKNVKANAFARKDIARILTELKARELSAEKVV